MNYQYKVLPNVYVDELAVREFLTDQQVVDLIDWQSNGCYTTTIPDCYCRIDILFGGKSSLDVTLTVYNSDVTKIIDQHKYEFVPNMQSTDNFIKQAYDHVKGKPEFSGAIDC
jgi:uncharacterized protein (DUF779 family)